MKYIQKIYSFNQSFNTIMYILWDFGLNKKLSIPKVIYTTVLRMNK